MRHSHFYSVYLRSSPQLISVGVIGIDLLCCVETLLRVSPWGNNRIAIVIAMAQQNGLQIIVRLLFYL